MYAELMNENVRIRAENVMLRKVVFALIAQADKDPFMSIGNFAEHGHASSALAEIRALNDEQERQMAQFIKEQMACDEMLANGPAMQRGTNTDGTPLMGTMREVMEDYKAAAEAEAKAADEARRENERLRGAARWALGLNNELQKECASLRRQNERLKALSRRIVVEQVLLDIANGKRDLPTREECRKLALKLGVPGEDLDKCEGEW